MWPRWLIELLRSNFLPKKVMLREAVTGRGDIKFYKLSFFSIEGEAVKIRELDACIEHDSEG